jgi:hypothetical protein
MQIEMDDRGLREYLVSVIEGRGAHITFDQAVADFPADTMGARVEGLDHTPWGLVYHMDACLTDIIEFIRYTDYSYPDYPSGLWPETDGPSSPAEWDRTAAAVKEGIKTLAEMVQDEHNDLFAPFPHSAEHTLFREVVTAADHNSYHIGQLVDIRMLLGIPVKDW